MKVLKVGFLALCLSACATQVQEPPKPNPLKLCAQSLVILQAASECTMLTPNICMFTEGDLERTTQAAADKQVYCPRLKPGQEEANQ